MMSSNIAHVHIALDQWTCSFMYHFNSLLEHTSLQLFRSKQIIAHIAISVLPGTDLHLSEVKHARVKFLAQIHKI